MTTVLVVEDDRSILRFIELNLTAEGYDVRSARDVPSAFALIETIKPDLFILDLNLPSLSGWEMLSMLKRRPDLAHIPVAILTATAAPEEQRRAQELRQALERQRE
ncbi:MAG: response regulator [Peptococcaceae bacterium]|nr:response regulator [Peptococcaceae bacterium]